MACLTVTMLRRVWASTAHWGIKMSAFRLIFFSRLMSSAVHDAQRPQLASEYA